MDTWSPKQLKMMQVGGNANFKKFLEEHGVPSNITLLDKYNSEVCKLYKEKITCLAEGKAWQLPKQKPVFRSSRGGLGLVSSGTSNPSPSTARNKDAETDGWEEWLDGDKSSSRRQDRKERKEKRRSPSPSPSPSTEPNSIPVSATRESVLRTHTYDGSNEQLQRFRSSQSISSDDFYGQTGNGDSGKSHQSKDAQNNWNLANTDEYLSYLNAGFQKLTVAASVGVEKLAEGTSTVTKTLQEHNWSEDASAWKQTMVETSSQGWGLVSSYWQQAKQSLDPTVSSWLGYTTTTNNSTEGISSEGNDSPWTTTSRALSSDLLLLHHQQQQQTMPLPRQGEQQGIAGIQKAGETKSRQPLSTSTGSGGRHRRDQQTRSSGESRKQRGGDKKHDSIGNGWDNIAWSSDSDDEAPTTTGDRHRRSRKKSPSASAPSKKSSSRKATDFDEEEDMTDSHSLANPTSTVSSGWDDPGDDPLSGWDDPGSSIKSGADDWSWDVHPTATASPTTKKGPTSSSSSSLRSRTPADKWD